MNRSFLLLWMALLPLISTSCADAADQGAEAATEEVPPQNMQQGAGAKKALSLLIIDTKLDGELLHLKTKLAYQGGSGADGEPITLEYVVSEAFRLKDEHSKLYRALIEQVPEGSLQNALKQDFAAQIGYLNCFANAGGGNALECASRATQDVDRARSQLEMERQLAFN